MSVFPNPAELFSFSSLEEALHGDNAGKLLVDELNWVAERRQQAAATLNDGLDQQAHSQNVHLLNAFDSATAILKSAPLRKDLKQ